MKNKQEKIKYAREYYQKNKELCKAKRKAYYIENKNTKKSFERKIIAEYMILHKEEIEQMKKERSKEKTKIYQMLYFQNNKEKVYKKRGLI